MVGSPRPVRGDVSVTAVGTGFVPVGRPIVGDRRTQVAVAGADERPIRVLARRCRRVLGSPHVIRRRRPDHAIAITEVGPACGQFPQPGGRAGRAQTCLLTRIVRGHTS
jgi:hypothetical protein